METRSSAFERLAEISVTDGETLDRLAHLLDPDCAFDLPTLRAAVRSGATSVYVLRQGPLIAASATAVRFATPTGRHCRIEDVVVDVRCRGRGLGRRIMERTLAALAADGVATVELTSRPAREAANALYRSLGFRRRETNVYALSLTRQSTCRVSERGAG